jgi:NADPH-dependent glutamate synthase beta subunit-like oxidoreductase
VVVVGGGNVAVDAAQTALRLGAESVTIVCLEARGELPAFPWAVESALAEKIEFQYGWGPVRFLGDGGVVSGVELQRCERVFDDQGRFNPQWRPDERRTAAADTAVVAVGQARDTSLFAGTGLLRDGGVRADPLTLQTDDEKTFLAGDFATGPSTAVEAMAQGRQAAESVDRFLRGEPIRYGRQYAGPYVRDFEIPIRPDPPRDRARTPTHVCGGAGDFAEIELSLGSEAARREAARCNHCGSPIGFHNTCWFCLPCEVECPYEAIRIEVPYWLR